MNCPIREEPCLLFSIHEAAVEAVTACSLQLKIAPFSTDEMSFRNRRKNKKIRKSKWPRDKCVPVVRRNGPRCSNQTGGPEGWRRKKKAV